MRQHWPLFLVGGYDRDDHLPCLYRVNVKANHVKQSHAAGRFGLAWEGQSDAVERFIRGYDSAMRASIEGHFTLALQAASRKMGDAAASMLQQVLDRAKIPLPGDIDTELPAVPRIGIPWDRHRCDIAYGNLPLQDAVDLASFLVGLQSGKSKFEMGVPTVGGRTHVGIVTRHEGFRMLAEPEVASYSCRIRIMIVRDYESFGMATEPEPKRTYVKPDSYGTSPEDQSSDIDTLLKPGKRLKIVEVRGRLEVVECE